MSSTVTIPRSYNRKAHVAKVPIGSGEIDNAGLKLLDPTRQKKLKDIRDREELKGKKDQLKGVLVKKMTFKYGSVNIDAITEAIDEFVENSDSITANALNKLESIIQSKIGVAKPTDKGIGSNNSASSSAGKSTNYDRDYESNNQSAAASSQSQNNSSALYSSTNLPPAAKNAEGKEWQVIATYDKLVGDDIERKEREKARQSRLAFKKNLDEHVSLAKQLHAQTDGLDELKYSQHVSQDVVKFRQDEESKHKQLESIQKEIARLRKQQISEQERRKQEEKIKAMEFELGIVATALEKMQLDNEIQKSKVHQTREMRMKIEQDNVANKKIIATRKEMERKEDQRLMAEYSAKLDREAYEREHAFAKRMTKMDKNNGQFNETVGRALADEERKREALQMKELEATMEKEKQEFLRKEREKRMRIQKMLADNNVLTEHREEEKRREIMLKTQVAEQYKKDEEELKKLQEAEKIRKLNEQKRYNDLLSQQLEDRNRHRTKLEEMVLEEKKINKDKLIKALTTEEIVNAVLNKSVKVQPVRSLGPF